MVSIKETRRIEIGSDILDHHIGCVAPPADRDIAVRERESVQRDAICALDHGKAGLGFRILRGGR